MSKHSLIGRIVTGWVEETIDVEFGRTQANMDFSGRGSIARKLKLKRGDKVKVTIEKLKK